jgi:hypothetical protein
MWTSLKVAGDPDRVIYRFFSNTFCLFIRKQAAFCLPLFSQMYKTFCFKQNFTATGTATASATT